MKSIKDEITVKEKKKAHIWLEHEIGDEHPIPGKCFLFSKIWSEVSFKIEGNNPCSKAQACLKGSLT